ncbi:MAG TPA: hypothetical protein HPP87_13225 [Planctomycetes bacterium]|nr:hypothetical protein [Planctomycetota bacterium]
MKVQAQISIYPLKTDSLSVPIDEFCRLLEEHGLKVKTLPMSSLVVGESENVFESVQEAFEKLAQKYNVVMDFKISNACLDRIKNKRELV